MESRGHSALGSLRLGGAAPAGPGAARRGLSAQLATVCAAAATRWLDPLVGTAVVFRGDPVYGSGVLLPALPRPGAFAHRLAAGWLCVRVGRLHRQHGMAADGEWRCVAALGVPVSAARRPRGALPAQCRAFGTVPG